jgi:hypothetical protein
MTVAPTPPSKDVPSTSPGARRTEAASVLAEALLVLLRQRRPRSRGSPAGTGRGLKTTSPRSDGIRRTPERIPSGSPERIPSGSPAGPERIPRWSRADPPRDQRGEEGCSRRLPYLCPDLK